MIDHWFGRILDALDEQDLWDDTAVDRLHRPRPLPRRAGGGRTSGASPAVPQYEPLGHIPLLVAWPGVDRRRHVRRAHDERRPARHPRRRVRRDRRAPHPRPLARAAARPATPTSVRDWALGGVYGNWVQVTDGTPQVRPRPGGRRTSRCRCGRTAGRRCRCTIAGVPTCPRPDDRAALDLMPGSDVPVIRQPFEPGDLLPFWVGRAAASTTTTSTTSTSTPTSRRTGEANRPRRTWPTSCARRSPRSTPPPSSSRAWPWTDPSSATG